MKMLVCVSGGTYHKRVADFALRLAKKAAAEVILLHVNPKPWMNSRGYLEKKEADQLEDSMEPLPDQEEQFLNPPAQAMERAGVSTRSMVVEGENPVAAILETAQEQDIDLIICGSTEQRMVEELLQPSIAMQLARKCEGALLLVPSDPNKEDEPQDEFAPGDNDLEKE